MEDSQAASCFAALAHPVRLRVFRALVVAGAGGLTPGALAQSLVLPAATLSFHLKELMHTGLVLAQRSGRHIHYRPALERMNALLAYLTEHCCQGQSCLSPPSLLCKLLEPDLEPLHD
ncbi:MAG: metalloregulator ArsR/SmtB family transcription factor [Serpentinimonas sp.]|nr:MAG: ArsR family transcriptional regulator [Comamonadaceae bacterium BICA1-1]MDO9612604.1 metalloregulator ArsR/SmtB family transcription factor [Serpentinimonas sp.]